MLDHAGVAGEHGMQRAPDDVLGAARKARRARGEDHQVERRAVREHGQCGEGLRIRIEVPQERAAGAHLARSRARIEIGERRPPVGPRDGEERAGPPRAAAHLEIVARNEGSHAEADECHGGARIQVRVDECLQLPGKVGHPQAAVARVERGRVAGMAPGLEPAVHRPEQAPRVRESVDHHDIHGEAFGMRRSHLFP